MVAYSTPEISTRKKPFAFIYFYFFKNVCLFWNCPAQLILLLILKDFSKLGFQALCTTELSWINFSIFPLYRFLWLLSQLFLALCGFAF